MQRSFEMKKITWVILFALNSAPASALDIFIAKKNLPTIELPTPTTTTNIGDGEPGDEGFDGEPLPMGNHLQVTTDLLCDERDVANGGQYIAGTDEDDILVGTAGDDVINGFAGNDIIYGNGGDDLICAGAGNDNVLGGNGDDEIYGDSGNDILYGDNDHHGDDFQMAPQPSLPGADFIYGGRGNDDIYGEAGNDTLHGQQGVNYIEGGAGRDTLVGGPEVDTLFGNDGADKIVGNFGNDIIYGGFGDDVISGGGGSDTIYGYQKASNEVQGFLKRHFNLRKIALTKQAMVKADLLSPPALVVCNAKVRNDFTDADLIHGGANGDTVLGGPDGDCIYGEGGTDRLFGEQGQDYIHGGDDEVDTLVGGTNPPGLEDLLIDPWGTDSITW